MIVQEEERFSVTYRLFGTEERARGMAEEICIEQTIEFPLRYVRNKSIKQHVIGRVESFRKIHTRCYEADISFLNETAGPDFCQFLNVIFGNSSLKPGIKVEGIGLSRYFFNLFKGPRFGIGGLRGLLGTGVRPLLCTALKPLGLSVKELASRAYQFARGGIDIIKDDHGLSDQVFSPFKERVKRCADAVKKANSETGGNALYASNITTGTAAIIEHAFYAKNKGAGACVISPGLTGYDNMKRISENDEIGLPVFYHPAFQGSYVICRNSGISPAVIFGELPRIAGADAVIFPNFGGRFTFSKTACSGVRYGCLREMGKLNKIFPVPGGGMMISSLNKMKRFYGTDVIFLIGGDLFAHGPDIVSTCRMFKDIVMTK
jgi:ribulose-bisphosphate carboxylase large chain